MMGFDRFTAWLVKEREEQIEAAKQFDEPLVNERLGHHDQNASGTAGEMEAMHDQTGFDRLAEAHLIRDEHARVQAARDFADELERSSCG